MKILSKFLAVTALLVMGASAQAAVDFSKLPHGLVVGLDHSYSPGGPGYAQGFDDQLKPTKYGFLTHTGAANGYTFREIGDHGASSGEGFIYQYLLRGVTNPLGNFIMPRGTVCGLKHVINSPDITCLGYDPALNLCPMGFTAKRKGDWRAPSGGDFAWCEWRDDENKCADGSCFDKLPAGLVCGLRSNAEDGELPSACGYIDETAGNECPNDFEFIGYYDAGRSAGRGLGWCQKRSVRPDAGGDL